MAEKDEYRTFIPNPSEDLYDMQDAGTIHGEPWVEKVPDFVKAILLANGYKSYSEPAEEEEGD